MATAAEAEAGSAVEWLTSLIDSHDHYDIPAAELLPTQLEAANELLADRIGKIKLLRNRAEEGGITEIRRAADIVPPLFALGRFVHRMSDQHV